MSRFEEPTTATVIVETEIRLSLAELCRACGTSVAMLESLVHEGVLTPEGDDPAQWRFEGAILPRARKAVRLSADLELGAPGTALVLELLDEIDSLKARLRRSGV
jgi:chaperone modulatory protein CbpM